MRYEVRRLKKGAARMKRAALISLVASCVLGLSACSKRYNDLPTFTAFPFNDSFNYSVGRFKTSYLADQIHAYYRGNTSAPIAIATFVDLDNLYGSSSFGRFFSEQLMSELTMKGYNVVELRQSQALQVLFDQGEFGLSRELSRIRQHQDVSGVIVGTYVVSPERVYVNARLIDPTSSVVLSAGSVEMAKTEEISRLLRTNSHPTAMERIPVRQLAMAPAPVPYYSPSPTLRNSSKFADEEAMYPEESKKHTTDIPAAKKSEIEPTL